MSSKKVVTRFAPSPTGYLHVGGARTALYNWLYARRNGGTFVLRIEDTDELRSTQDSVTSILEALRWLGLDWDAGPFYQSERSGIYNDHIRRLFEAGKIYPAFESKEELEAMRQKAAQERRNSNYNRASLKLSKDEALARMSAGKEFVWRFRVPAEGCTEVPELLMGGDVCRVKNESIEDFIISRPGTLEKPGMPLYNFVCAIDDALTGTTHVIRGVEHLTNASRQVLLYQALGYDLPMFVHLPLITKNGKKMSKRDVDADGKYPVSVMGRRDLGYLAEPTVNYLALLGWSPADGKEIMSRSQMIDAFDLSRLNRSNANFDEKKYLFFNAQAIKSSDEKELLKLVTPYLDKAGLAFAELDESVQMKLIRIGKERAKLLCDFGRELEFFFLPPQVFAADGVQSSFARDDVDAASVLHVTAERLGELLTLSKEAIDAALSQIVNETGVAYSIYGPIVRLALTGKTTSPKLDEMMDALGKEESTRRLAYAANWISSELSGRPTMLKQRSEPPLVPAPKTSGG